VGTIEKLQLYLKHKLERKTKAMAKKYNRSKNFQTVRVSWPSF